jgi:integrase/recombinase XerD
VTALAPTLQAFFTERLARQKNASPHTVAAYRDALRMLVQFAARRIGTAPARLQIEDVDARLVGAFLDHLEHDRGNSARSRNTRLAAIHSLFRFAALRHPEHAALDRPSDQQSHPSAATVLSCPSSTPSSTSGGSRSGVQLRLPVGA